MAGLAYPGSEYLASRELTAIYHPPLIFTGTRPPSSFSDCIALPPPFLGLSRYVHCCCKTCACIGQDNPDREGEQGVDGIVVAWAVDEAA